MWHHDDDDEPMVVIEKHDGSARSFFWGLLAGAGIALLFAPRSGEETRREIKRSAGRVKLIAQDTAEDLTDTVLDKYEHARRTVENTIDATKEAIDLKKKQASNAMRAGREAAQEARDDLERRIAETKAAYQAGANVARSGRTGPAPAGIDNDIDGTGGV